MANVKQVEASIGQNNAVSSLTPLSYVTAEFVQAQNFVLRMSAQWDLVAGADCSTARSSSCRETVAVPRFMTTMPPA